MLVVTDGRKDEQTALVESFQKKGIQVEFYTKLSSVVMSEASELNSSRNDVNVKCQPSHASTCSFCPGDPWCRNQRCPPSRLPQKRIPILCVRRCGNGGILLSAFTRGSPQHY
jgi:hypothetical protein